MALGVGRLPGLRHGADGNLASCLRAPATELGCNLGGVVPSLPTPFLHPLPLPAASWSEGTADPQVTGGPSSPKIHFPPLPGASSHPLHLGYRQGLGRAEALQDTLSPSLGQSLAPACSVPA